MPSQVCITRDNTQLQVDGILYFQVTDPMRASYGSSNYIVAITQLAQTTLRSVIGKMELDKTFEERDAINAVGRQRARRGGAELGREGAALRDQGPDAAGRDPALDAGADHRRAREARADRRLRRPASRSRSTSPPASARPSSPAPKASARPRSTRPRARPRRSSPSPRPRPTRSARSPRRSSSPAASRRCSSRWPSSAVEAYRAAGAEEQHDDRAGQHERGVGADRHRDGADEGTGHRVSELRNFPLCSTPPRGGMDERFKSHAWKACVG